MEEKEYIPTPQAMLNQALRMLSRALDEQIETQNAILNRLHESSRFISDFQRYGMFGSQAPRKKNNAFGEKEAEEGVRKVEN